MLDVDQDALICDMAETYHVLDIWALPVDLLAVLASGLRENSRIKMKISGMNYIPAEIVLPHIADVLTMVFLDDAGQKPTLFTEILTGKVKENEAKSFRSGEEFTAEWRRLTGGTANA